ncbi:pfs domain protein [Fusarium tjaetaba]|uniref:Pfs domain protein n=1 Tax=Fusarium tjaetaba TaxID=1567544 RepID=A0A8H5S1L1_9HYPO|nr:pfs domain protein [Fusarium tjaetaba]KAF5642457.1 pfs domain protein [Fusarium tjaetaba]
MTLINFPALPQWAQTLASILPLSALIEFVDVETSIHVYELRGGSVPYWNWPVSPAGARTLLSETGRDCLLDQPERSSKKLTCIDGFWGNRFPCSAPTTTLLWLESLPKSLDIKNDSPNMMNADKREQILHQIALTQPPTSSGSGLLSICSGFLRKRGPRYLSVSLIGWIFWITLVIISFMGGLYIGGTYLCLMPATGIVLRFTHGTEARTPVIRSANPSYPRLVIAAGTENSREWYAFRGKHPLLTGLFNVSLEQTERLPFRPFFLYLLRLLILSQWAAIVGSSATENWDAYVVSIWTTFCIAASSYGYPIHLAARDWLERDCKVDISKATTVLSGRNALLVALGTINPDKKAEKTQWMDPILAETNDRKNIWSAVIQRTSETPNEQTPEHSSGHSTEDSTRRTPETTNKQTPHSALAQKQSTPPWWERFVEEGVNIGKELDQEYKKNEQKVSAETL